MPERDDGRGIQLRLSDEELTVGPSGHNGFVVFVGLELAFGSRSSISGSEADALFHVENHAIAEHD
jgi:hypothetical protein